MFSYVQSQIHRRGRLFAKDVLRQCEKKGIEMELIDEIKIPSRTPITTKMVLETFKVIYKTEETAAMSTFSYLICNNPTIWVVKRETMFGDLWEVRRGLIIINVQYIEEIEWIVNTLKQSYRKRYEVEPEKENQNLCRNRQNSHEEHRR